MSSNTLQASKDIREKKYENNSEFKSHDIPQDIYKPQLDGLRFFIFLVIFFYHCNITSSYSYLGPCAVSMYSALSGWLITGILLNQRNNNWRSVLKIFYTRRFLRIFPTLYTTILLVSCFKPLPFWKWHLSFVFNVKMFLLSLNFQDPAALSFFTNWQDNAPHLWTLALEEQFYIFYPFIILLCPRRYTICALLGLLISCIASHIYLRVYFPGAFYGALLPVAGEYLIWGSIAAWCYYENILVEKIRPSYVHYAIIFLLVVLVRLAMPDHWSMLQFQPTPIQRFLAPAMAAFVLSLWQNSESLVSRFLAIAPFAWLGRLTYQFYVVHLFTWQMEQWLRGRLGFISPVSPELVRLFLTLTLGILLWNLTEIPIRKWKSRISKQAIKENLGTA